MLTVKYLVTPSPEQFEVAILGMRNALKSREKSDSGICYSNGYGYNADEPEKSLCLYCKYDDPNEDDLWCKKDDYENFVLGDKDKKLLLNLCSAGDPSHRKVLRQLSVIMDITGPLYWWKQMDTYSVGTTMNSESTMHTITKYPFKIEDFSVENYKSIFGSETKDQLKAFEDLIVSDLNDLRDRYLETNDKKYWYALNEILPQSYNQTRTWSANYEVLVNIINQRSHHKLGEWHQLIEYWLENVPYLKEIVEAINDNR